MIRLFVSLLWIALSGVAGAQESIAPVLKTDLAKDRAIPGQPLLYRVTLLVPTWMPKPPEFPSFEAANVVVRLPSRASSPTSERIDGETWSGVSRLYRLYPMAPGTFEIPSGVIKVTYADPDTTQPVEAEVATQAFQIIGEVPPGAEDLVPFLAAKSLKLTRQVEGETEDLSAGDALKVTAKVSVTGVAPMFIPPISETKDIEGLSIYSSEPVLDEKEDRGILSGTRTEAATLVAEFTGQYQIPKLSVSWFNLETGKVETATAPAVDFNVTGSAPEEIQNPTEFDWRDLAIRTFLVLAGIGLLAFAWRKTFPHLRQYFARRNARYQASELFAYRILKRQIRKRDFDATTRAGTEWQTRLRQRGAQLDWARFEKTLGELGATYFSRQAINSDANRADLWNRLRDEARNLRRQLHKTERIQQIQALPRLNPQ